MKINKKNFALIVLGVFIMFVAGFSNLTKINSASADEPTIVDKTVNKDKVFID